MNDLIINGSAVVVGPEDHLLIVLDSDVVPQDVFEALLHTLCEDQWKDVALRTIVMYGGAEYAVVRPAPKRHEILSNVSIEYDDGKITHPVGTEDDLHKWLLPMESEINEMEARSQHKIVKITVDGETTFVG